MITSAHVNTKKKWITAKTRKILDLHYEGRTVSEIASKLSTSDASVRVRLSRNGIAANAPVMPRRTTLNEDYFERIDTHRKAYFFGLICADGNVSTSKKRMTLVLKIEDSYLVHELKKEVGSTSKISQRKPNNGTMQEYIQLYSEKLISDLKKHGCGDRKSLTLELPHIEKRFFGSFIRGYFDGDGWYHETCFAGKVYKQMCLIGSTAFLVKLKEVLLAEFSIKSKFSEEKGKSYGVLMIASQPEVLKIRNLMYDNDTISLERKKKNFYTSYPSVKYSTPGRVGINWEKEAVNV